MTEAVQHLLNEADRLSQSERAQLAYALIQSLDDSEDPDAANLWDAELAKRSEEIRQGTAKGKRAEDLYRELSNDRT